MLDWQVIVVAVLVLAAALYVARALWRALFTAGGGGCGSCNSCGSSAKEEPQALVELHDLPRRDTHN